MEMPLEQGIRDVQTVGESEVLLSVQLRNMQYHMQFTFPSQEKCGLSPEESFSRWLP